LNADGQEERVRLLTALTRFDDPVIQDQGLDFIWNTVDIMLVFFFSN